MHSDIEINALSNVYEALKVLNNAQIKRILDWVTSKFDLDNQPGLKAVEREVEPTTSLLPGVTTVEASVTAGEPVKRRRGRRPGKEKTTKAPLKKRRGRLPGKVVPAAEAPVPQPAETPTITGFIKYDNFDEFLLFSTAHTSTAKVLLAAAYLQEKKKLKEFCSNDISTLFNEIGEEIIQTAPYLSNLMSKNPPLMIQTGTEGPGLKSRRYFRVTEEGLRIALNYIKE